MPLTKISIAKGERTEFLKRFMDCVHESLVETIKIPQNDRNQMLTEFEPEFFIAKPPYKYFIEITMFTGRTAETKKKLFRKLVDKLESELKTDPKSVFIIIHDQPRENWGVRGGIAASEIKLDFDVNV